MTFFGKQTPEEDTPLELRSDLMMRKMESNESLTAKLLSTQASDAADDRCAITDPLLRGLVDRLPKADSTWSLDDRAKWLSAAARIFDLVYKTSDGECREVSIVLSSKTPPQDEGLLRPQVGSGSDESSASA